MQSQHIRFAVCLVLKRRWRRFACRVVREKPALNETRPPAAIAKRRVVFRVMNTELNNMRLCDIHRGQATGWLQHPAAARLSNCSGEIVAHTPARPRPTLYRSRWFNREFFRISSASLSVSSREERWKPALTFRVRVSFRPVCAPKALAACYR